MAKYLLFGLQMQFLIDFKQVIMDVVLNHTAEGNEKGPIFSFRGVDNSVYYMLAPKVMLSLFLFRKFCCLGNKRQSKDLWGINVKLGLFFLLPVIR